MDTRGYKVGDRLRFIGPFKRKGQICTIASFDEMEILFVNVVFEGSTIQKGFYFNETRFDFGWVDPLKKSKILGEGRKNQNKGMRLIRG